MSDQYDLNQPIYQVGESTLSFSDMLGYFINPEYKRGNLSRISDMHVKTGRPVSFRIDDDLTPMPGGIGVTDEVLRYMLGILLNEKHLRTVTDEDDPQDVDTAFEWK
ncbi:MAG: twitching motility protein, partial [Verrucomicrobiota bacterium]|nr:twitching motility protein [Verrucomicrobiota bacterium]